MSAFLLAWGEVVTGVGALVDEALEVEPVGGSSVAWSASRTRLGVSPMPEPTRQETCRARKQTRGAPVTELDAVLDAFVESRRELVLSMLTPPQRTVALQSLETLLEHAKAHFAAKSIEVVKRGLFKHAKVAASKHQYGTSSRPEVYVMECPSCRGPRQTEALTCVFCGSDL
ncbi:MAG: hypothetical protein Q8L14_22790 [Myxococcales bacterium]|nr:hypothetical protein [Myxococcales bacterium]